MPIASRFGGNSLRAFGQRGIVRAVDPSDPYFSYVSMLLSTTSLGNATNNLFVDSSGVFNPIDRVGTASPGSFSPYGSNWSNYFDGSGDNLKTPNNVAFAYGTNDFTWEMWVYPTASDWAGGSTNLYLLDHGSNGGVIQYYANVIRYYNSTTGFGTLYNDGGSIPVNTWTHVAVSRQSGTTRLFVNGVLKTSQSDAHNYGSNVVTIADYGSGGYAFPGYISNVRIVKGTALYTSAFTPSTSPLTAVSGTSLLTCQGNRFIDASTNNFAITRAGDVQVTKFSPFSPSSTGIAYNQNDITNWSGYFDGTGDYVDFPSSAGLSGSGNFTIQAFIYPTTVAGDCCIYETRGGTGWVWFINSGGYLQVYDSTATLQTASTTQLTANQWTHVALVKNGSTCTYYVNGASAGTFTLSSFAAASRVRIGARNDAAATYFGYISNLRTDTAALTITVPTSNLPAVGTTTLLTLQNAAFTDNSTNNFVATPNGDATVSGNSPFNPTGYWSLSSSAINAGAVVPQTTATDLGSGSFTIECWVNRQSTGSIVTKRRTDTALTGSWALSTGASGYFTFLGVGWGPTHTSTGFIPVGKWTHLVVTRSGTNLSMYVDGVRVYNATDNYDYTCSTYMIIKLWGNAGGNYPAGNTLTDGMPGSISNLRIVQGTSVYDPSQSSITVPTSPLTAVSGTSFLSLQNGTIKDNSPNNVSISLYNGGILQSADPFYTSTTTASGGSVYLDGSSTYLQTAASPANNPRTGDFTLECWAYPLAFPDDSYLLIFLNSTNSYYVALEIRQAQVAAHTYFGGHGDVQFTDLAPRLNAWNHMVVSRINGTLYGYLNGVRSSVTSSLTSDLGAGNASVLVRDSQATYKGYISDARATIGSGVYPNSTYTVPTAPLSSTASTVFLLNGTNAGIYDATGKNHLQTIGNAQVSTSVKKYGTSSMYFDGTGDWLEHGNKTEWAWLHNGLQDWTIEWWMYHTSTTTQYGIMCTNINSVGGAYGMLMGVNFDPNSGNSATGVVAGHFTRGVDGNRMDWTTGNVLSANQWNHVAVMFNRTTKNVSVYVNGVAAATTNKNMVSNSWTGGDGSAFSYVTNDPSFNLNIGRAIGGASGSVWHYNGYIDDLRITRGIRRYTSNFTPPTRALPIK